MTNPSYPGWLGVCEADVLPAADVADDARFIVVVAGEAQQVCIDWHELTALACQMDDQAAEQLLESVEVLQ